MKCFPVLPVSTFKYTSIGCFKNKELTLKYRWGTEASGDNSDAWKQTGRPTAPWNGWGSLGRGAVVVEERFVRAEAVGADGSVCWDELLWCTKVRESGRNWKKINMTRCSLHTNDFIGFNLVCSRHWGLTTDWNKDGRHKRSLKVEPSGCPAGGWLQSRL